MCVRSSMYFYVVEGIFDSCYSAQGLNWSGLSLTPVFPSEVVFLAFPANISRVLKEPPCYSVNGQKCKYLAVFQHIRTKIKCFYGLYIILRFKNIAFIFSVTACPFTAVYTLIMKKKKKLDFFLTLTKSTVFLCVLCSAIIDK